jgi:hypothetical protein
VQQIRTGANTSITIAGHHAQKKGGEHDAHRRPEDFCCSR